MIRLLVVDDHPAVLNGLVAALRSEPGLIPVATADGAADALRRTRSGDIDVALVDLHLLDGDGLRLCHKLKLKPGAPAVVIYSAFTDVSVRLAAALVGADGIVDKAAPLEHLFDAVRAAARGERSVPGVPVGDDQVALARLDPEDAPILGMRIDGASLGEVASVLGLSEPEVAQRVRGMVERLTAPERPRYMDGRSYLGATTD